MGIDIVYLQKSLGDLHPYFSTGDVREKYVFVIDAARADNYLDERQADILRRRIDQSLPEIAKAYERSPERIRQIEAQALRRLRFHCIRRGEVYNAHYLDELRSQVEEGTALPEVKFLIGMYDAAESTATARVERIAELERELSQGSGRDYVNVHQMYVKDLGIPIRAIHGLEWRGRILTFDQLLQKSKNDLLKETRDLGEDSIRRVRIALGYLGLALRGSEPYSFPSQEELYQMPTSFILSTTAANKLIQHGIETVQDLAENKDKLQSALGPDLMEEVSRAMKFYKL